MFESLGMAPLEGEAACIPRDVTSCPCQVTASFTVQQDHQRMFERELAGSCANRLMWLVHHKPVASDEPQSVCSASIFKSCQLCASQACARDVLAIPIFPVILEMRRLRMQAGAVASGVLL